MPPVHALPFSFPAATSFAGATHIPSAIAPLTLRRTGFDIPSSALPATDPAAADGDARRTALETAKRLADALSAAAPPGALAAAQPCKSLDELLARDRARIAAADQRNMNYVLEQQRSAKERARAAAQAALAAAEAEATEATASALTSQTKPTQASASRPPPSTAEEPPAKVARASARSNTGAAAACSVYVAGLPLDTSAEELETLMQQACTHVCACPGDRAHRGHSPDAVVDMRSHLRRHRWAPSPA